MTVYLLIAVLGCVSTSPAHAELEIDVDSGLWIPFLPDYTAGSIVAAGVAEQRDLFRDHQSDAGVAGGVSGFYRATPDSCRVDFDLGIAGVDSMGSSGTFADPGIGQRVWFASLDGLGFIGTNNGNNATFTLDSDVFFNRQYVGLGDTWLLFSDPNREVDLGVGFSHLGFDQDFALNVRMDNGLTGQYLESLDSDYLGGEFRGTMLRRYQQRDWLLEFGVGFFNMNARYRGQSFARNGVGVLLDTDTVTDEIDRFAVTTHVGLRLDTEWAGVNVRPGITLDYISDMPQINHPMTEIPNSTPVFLSTTSGYFLGLNLEVFLWDGCCRRR